MRIHERFCLSELNSEELLKYYKVQQDALGNFVEVGEVEAFSETITKDFILTYVKFDAAMIRKESLLELLELLSLTNVKSNVIINYAAHTDSHCINIITPNECHYCYGQGFEMVGNKLCFCKQCAGHKVLKINVKHPLQSVVDVTRKHL